MGAIGAHVPRSVETGIPPARREVELDPRLVGEMLAAQLRPVELTIVADATKAQAELFRAQVQLQLVEIKWRSAVSSQRRDERRELARARRIEQRLDRIANGTDRATLRAAQAARHA